MAERMQRNKISRDSGGNTNRMVDWIDVGGEEERSIKVLGFEN